jgi:hypothetical protein
MIQFGKDFKYKVESIKTLPYPFPEESIVTKN